LRSKNDCRSQFSAHWVRASTFAAPFLSWLCILWAGSTLTGTATSFADSLPETIDRTQPKIVKIYGAGGFRGLESYQTGILISPNGHVLTVYSHVLDTASISAVLADGRRFDARLLGADPRLETAVLKIDTAGLPCFELDQAVEADAGTRVLALSNLFGVAVGNEPVSAQKGTVSVATRLDGRRGAFETPYRGPIYVLDVTTSNPGAAGGAVVTHQGKLVGMLGKELRNAQNETWLNYAVPSEELRRSVDAILSGKSTAAENEARRKPRRPLDLNALGIILIPDVVDRTPPYVDRVRPGWPADKAGLRPDDLIVLLGNRLVQSCKGLESELAYVDFEDAITLTVQRGQELIVVSLRSDEAVPSPRGDQP